MDISTHDEVPKDLTPLDQELLVSKKRDEMLRIAEKEMKEVEEEQSEYVMFMGIRKHRMRCPKCGRAALYDFCIVHGDVEAIDLTKSKKAQEMTREIIKWKNKK